MKFKLKANESFQIVSNTGGITTIPADAENFVLLDPKEYKQVRSFQSNGDEQ